MTGNQLNARVKLKRSTGRVPRATGTYQRILLDLEVLASTAVLASIHGRPTSLYRYRYTSVPYLYVGTGTGTGSRSTGIEYSQLDLAA